MWPLCKTTSGKNLFFWYLILQMSNSRRTARKKRKWADGEANKPAVKPERKRIFFLEPSHSPIRKKKRLQLNYPTTNPLYLLLKVSVYEMPPLVHFCDRLLGHLQYPHGGVWGRLAAWYLFLISWACSWSANAGRANDQLSRKWVNTAKLTSTAVTEMATKQNHSKFNHLLWISPRYAQNAKQGNKNDTQGMTTSASIKKKNDCL